MGQGPSPARVFIGLLGKVSCAHEYRRTHIQERVGYYILDNRLYPVPSPPLSTGPLSIDMVIVNGLDEPIFGYLKVIYQILDISIQSFRDVYQLASTKKFVGTHTFLVLAGWYHENFALKYLNKHGTPPKIGVCGQV